MKAGRRRLRLRDQRAKERTLDRNFVFTFTLPSECEPVFTRSQPRQAQTPARSPARPILARCSSGCGSSSKQLERLSVANKGDGFKNLVRYEPMSFLVVVTHAPERE